MPNGTRNLRATREFASRSQARSGWTCAQGNHTSALRRPAPPVKQQAPFDHRAAFRGSLCSPRNHRGEYRAAVALYEQLRVLVDTHGPAILDQAEGFRAALDDFLTEDEATAGELNLLVDAVRLGSVRRLVELLDQGATPEAALADAGAQLARDRDTEPKRAQWALSVLGFAIRRLDATIPTVTVEEAPSPPADEVPPQDTFAATLPVEPDRPAVEATRKVADPAPAAVNDSSGVPTSSATGRRLLRIGAPLAALLVVGGVVAALVLPGDDDGDNGGDDRAGTPSVSEPADEPIGGSDDCPAPATPPVDPQADAAATCLAGQFDQWADASVMALGQQVNLDNDEWTGPLTQLAPGDVPIVGFDFQELASAGAAGKDRVPDLIQLAEQGHVLIGSWHADNPWTGQPYFDLTDREKFDELIAPEGGSPAFDTFWEDWDEVIAAVQRFSDAGVPIILRPLHEANGEWFWWAHHDPEVFKELWTQLRTRVEDAGLHNVLWHFAAAPVTYDGVMDPLELLPEVDFAGIDTYDCEQPGTRAERLECGGGKNYEADQVDLTSYAELAGAAPRMSLSEVGPQFSFDGSWDPSIVTTSVIEQGFQPVYAMFWFDDQRSGRPPMSKQLASLQGGPELLASCSGALCYVGDS